MLLLATPLSITSSDPLSSYGAPGAGHPRFTEMLEALSALFQTHQVDGTITIEQETHVYYGQLSNT